MSPDSLLEIENLTVQYNTQTDPVTAVSNASFTLTKGEYFGLVGESGCGKSTMAKALIGSLDSNGSITSGTIRYKGTEIQDMTEAELNDQIRWKEISYIPQSSMNSLDPLQRIHEQAIEIGKVHTDLSQERILDKLREMFDVVGLQESRIKDYPHQFSGGMQQRAIIALALFLDPTLIIADEPTTALDVIMQDQVFKYLDKVRDEAGVSMMLITHDISVVFESADRMAVMHAGQIVETGSVEGVYDSPRHPYSVMLQKAFPDLRYPNRELKNIKGTPPQLGAEVDFCTFADRCPLAVEECYGRAPTEEQAIHTEDNEQIVACHRQEDVASMSDEEWEKRQFDEVADTMRGNND